MKKSKSASDPTEAAVVGSGGCFAPSQRSDADPSTSQLALTTLLYALRTSKMRWRPGLQ